MHDVLWTKENIGRLWSYYSKNLNPEEYFSFHSGKYILGYLRRRLDFNNFESILDFGCGPGYLLEALMSLSRAKVYGFDFSKEAIDIVNKKFSAYKNFSKAYSAERLPMPFDAETMDLVIAVEVIEHLQDADFKAMLVDIHRILKPTGLVVFTTPHKENLGSETTICPECGCVFHRWQHVRSWNIGQLQAAAQEADFRTLRAEATVFGSFLKRRYWNYCKAINRKVDYPHLVYIGRKNG